ncbi:SIS domain-containing protein [Sulfurimonas sp.]|uniref:D-sedoheptulose-7-phosphate isomerase n=1 Tax=Sulfurimonas sp. TaxID=2022749 RepID=UPI003562467C
MNNYINKHINESIEVKKQILDNINIINNILKASQVCIKAYKDNKKILIAGNGGSAADAQHIAGELVSRFYFDRPGLAAVALTTDTSILTAIGNDYGYEKIFSRQIEANGDCNDIFIAISTSGNSKNIIEAIVECKKKGITTIGLTGNENCQIDELCDICIKVPSSSTPRIQESHILIGHILCAIIEEEIFGDKF